MHMQTQQITPLTRISIAVYDWATALTAVVVIWGNGISWHIGWSLVSFGLLVDINRFTSARIPHGLNYNLGFLRIPVRVYFRPLSTVYLMAAAILALLLLYYAIPNICWPAFNSWVEANFSIVNWRLHGFPDACDVPHGAVLLLAQILVPLIIILGVAIPLSSAQFEPVRFLDDLERDTHGHIRRAATPSQPKPALLGMVIAVVWMYILLVGMINFTTDDPSIIHTKPLRPHTNVFHLVLWCTLMFFPQTFFVHISAGGWAGMRIFEDRLER